MKQDANRSRTISLETGIQNGPLAVLIVTLTFSGEMQQQVLLIPVLHSLFSVTTSSAITVFFRRMAERETLARDPALLDDRVKVYAAARHANPNRRSGTIRNWSRSTQVHLNPQTEKIQSQTVKLTA